MRKEKAKRVSLKLSIEELNLLGRLVGNHTSGDDKTAFGLYGKICTLGKHEGIDYKTWEPGRQVHTGNDFPVLRFD